MSYRPTVLSLPHPGDEAKLTEPYRAVVVGGGIAGIAAATVLAERGAQVTLLEREATLGGRAGAWIETLESGERVEMERGFHAFFRQYYNLRALLRRIDPELDILAPVDDYPIIGPDGAVESFSGLPHTPPFNIIALTKRTKTMSFRELLGIDLGAAKEMLSFDPDTTYARFDTTSATEYLDSLRFPVRARRMLFDVFAHSFFNPEADMSAAELLMMFHFYFTGNREGLIFDVAKRPFATGLWEPFARYLRSLGVSLVCERAAERVVRDGEGFRVVTDDAIFAADGVVLATTVTGLQAIVGASPELDDPSWREQVTSLKLTRPFAVWRLWLGAPTDPRRAPFVGTTGLGYLDNISLFHLFEDESRAWADKHGGAVVELHAYAIDTDADELKRELLAGLHAVYPETRGARVIDERFFIRGDCPAFSPGSHGSRPAVSTPFSGVTLAGDYVRLPIPSALMERAAASGMLAANHLLASRGVAPEPILSVAPRGLFALPRMRRPA